MSRWSMEIRFCAASFSASDATAAGGTMVSCAPCTISPEAGHGARNEKSYLLAGGAMATKLLISGRRSEEHTSELQSLMRISYAVFCLKKKKHIVRKKSFKGQTEHKCITMNPIIYKNTKS